VHSARESREVKQGRLSVCHGSRRVCLLLRGAACAGIASVACSFWNVFRVAMSRHDNFQDALACFSDRHWVYIAALVIACHPYVYALLNGLIMSVLFSRRIDQEVAGIRAVCAGAAIAMCLWNVAVFLGFLETVLRAGCILNIHYR